MWLNLDELGFYKQQSRYIILSYLQKIQILNGKSASEVRLERVRRADRSHNTFMEGK